jgi:hypothetical protein
MMMMKVIFLVVLILKIATEYMRNNNNNPTTGPSSSLNKTTIALSSAQFMPLTNPIYNQLKVIVQYKTNDASLLNTKANGLRVFSLDGTIIKTSSFPNGFLLNQTGSINLQHLLLINPYKM